LLGELDLGTGKKESITIVQPESGISQYKNLPVICTIGYGQMAFASTAEKESMIGFCGYCVKLKELNAK